MTLNYVSFIKNQKESPFYKLNEMIEIDTNIQYIGKRVKIADDSEYKYQAYRDNGNGEGEIIYCDIYDEDFQYRAGDHIFTVRWDNGHEDGYRTKDLTLIENIEETNIKKIRWYKSGKFVADVIDQPEKSTPIAGGIYHMDKLYFYNSDVDQDFERNLWVASSGGMKRNKVTRYQYIISPFYTGYVVKLRGRWPWYQFNNFIPEEE